MNVLTSLGAGSGIDVRALAENLVSAERTPRLKLLDDRQQRVDARISALGQFRSALDALVGALGSRISSGSLAGQPSISDPSLLTMRIDPGAVVPRQQIEVRALARAQTLASAPVADPAAPVGQGTLTFRFGTVAGETAATGLQPGTLPDLTATVGSDRDSLTGLRDAINDAAASAGTPLQARLVTDATGTRLLLRGAEGDVSGFTVEAAGDPALGAFAFGVGSDAGPAGGLQRTQAAADARLALDGLELRRPSNLVADLVPGARLTLVRASPGQPVTIEAQRDPAELAQSVRDIAAALNELTSLGRSLSASNPGAGSPSALASDGATRRALQQLGLLTSRELIPPNGTSPTRFAEIGLTRDRNGVFSVDEARLVRATVGKPAAIEAMVTALNAPARSGTLAGPLRQLAEAFRTAAQGSGGQPTALQREAAAIARERVQLDNRTERSREAYTRQFASLDRSVGQSKALQGFLQQQINLWTRSRD